MLFIFVVLSSVVGIGAECDAVVSIYVDVVVVDIVVTVGMRCVGGGGIAVGCVGVVICVGAGYCVAVVRWYSCCWWC